MLNGAGELVANDMCKAEVLNGFFSTVFTNVLEGNTSLQGSHVLEDGGKVHNKVGGGGSGY